MVKQILVFAFCSFLMVSCDSLPTNSLSTLPQEAKDATISLEEVTCQTRLLECKDFKISHSKPLEITAAEKANGVTEKWCVSLKYVFKSKGDKEWRDGRNYMSNMPDNFGSMMAKKNGTWERLQTPDFGFCECKQ